MEVYFSDYFEVDPEIIEQYGAFNISLKTDLPLFIDPFLLFNSKKKKYQELHEQMLQYLRFLKDKSVSRTISKGLIKAWYTFPEIKQNWFGYCEAGNRGSGLGSDFANALNENLNSIFSNFGSEQITKGSHLEKLCLISDGVGRDNISDFTTNLIHEYLLNYTQFFAKKYIKPELRKKLTISHVRFNYITESWERDLFDLPYYNNDYVLLTPKDILTRDEAWINRPELINHFEQIPLAIPNDILRSQVNNYFYSVLSDNPSREEMRKAVSLVIQKFPVVIDYYIRQKEDSGDLAKEHSLKKVSQSKELYIEQFKKVIELLEETDFYKTKGDSYQESIERVAFLKDIIENKDGYKLFYVDGQPLKREADLQILYRLTWFATSSDVNREVNNGRGPVDFKVSRGNKDKTLIEFKLANNTQLKKNLLNQVKIYEKANDTNKSIKVILYFSETELKKVIDILNELDLAGKEDIVLIDARNDNKPSASKAS